MESHDGFMGLNMEIWFHGGCDNECEMNVKGVSENGMS